MPKLFRFLYGYKTNGEEKEAVIMADSKKEAWEISQQKYPNVYNMYLIEDKPKLPKFMRF